MRTVLLILLVVCVLEPAILTFQEPIRTYAAFRTARSTEQLAVLTSLATQADSIPEPEELRAILTDALNDPDKEMRKRGLTAVASRVGAFRFSSSSSARVSSQNDYRALEPLRSVVVARLNDTDAAVRDAAVMAIGNFDAAQSPGHPIRLTPQTVTVLVARYKIEPDRTVRASIIQGLALSANREDSLNEIFIAGMSDVSAEVRQFAATGIGRLVFRPALSLLVRALSDPDSAVRSATARGIARFGASASELATVLLDAANEERDPAVRAEFQRAAEALRRPQ